MGFDNYFDVGNPISSFRKRVRPKLKLKEWISETIEYDYDDIESLEYVIFAPRINEGCLVRDKGSFLIRNITAKKQNTSADKSV